MIFEEAVSECALCLHACGCEDLGGAAWLPMPERENYLASTRLKFLNRCFFSYKCTASTVNLDTAGQSLLADADVSWILAVAGLESLRDKETSNITS